MMLHRLVDRALSPLVRPMGLEHSTEGYLTVDRDDLVALAGAPGNPQGVLVDFGPQAPVPGLVIAEPSLCTTVLGRIWRSTRNDGAPLTQVEGEILRQFMAKVVGQWRGSWTAEGMSLAPQLTMAGSLSMVTGQLVDGPWHIARTVVRDGEDPVGVLLFCYPAALLDPLGREARRITWRERIRRGLQPREAASLERRLGTALRDVVITAPVTITQTLTLGTIDGLERGDVIEFDPGADGQLALRVLDRELRGRLAQTPRRLALVLDGPAAEHTSAPHGDGSQPAAVMHAANDALPAHTPTAEALR